MDVAVDMSKVIFMCTANDLETISVPLLHRMEVLRLPGYDVPEEVQIAEKYLVPKALRESGLMEAKDSDDEKKENEDSDSINEVAVLGGKVPKSLSIATSAIEKLVRWYCREAGVRNLNKYVEKISRKLTLQVVAEEEGTELTKDSRRKSDSWIVSKDNLKDCVGKPIFTSDRLYDEDPCLPQGIVMGLAWTSMGGCALYIETQAIQRGVDSDGKPKGGGILKVTGQLGNVMEESTQITYTMARSRLAKAEPSYS